LPSCSRFCGSASCSASLGIATPLHRQIQSKKSLFAQHSNQKKNQNQSNTRRRMLKIPSLLTASASSSLLTSNVPAKPTELMLIGSPVCIRTYFSCERGIRCIWERVRIKLNWKSTIGERKKWLVGGGGIGMRTLHWVAREDVH
jgi:hypothetical protein